MPITKEAYGKVDGSDIYQYTLTNGCVEIKVINFGATITHIRVPDKEGNVQDILLGFDNLEGYVGNDLYISGVVGRCANRIAKGQFTLDGTKYSLATNNGPNALHGGVKGFNKRVWQSEVNGDSLVCSYTSPDGEESYPGNLKVKVTYRLTTENELVINYNATTDKPTIVNLTNHPYFNLAGHNSGSLDNHMVRLDADYITQLDNNSVPTGVKQNVEGTMYDLRQETELGARLPLVPGGVGFDINYALGRPGWDKHVARVRHHGNGRTLDMYSTEPGVQFYTAFYVDNLSGKGGAVHNKFCGFCLEGQHYPDSPNQPDFPPIVLRPGQEYKQTTKYVFGIQKDAS